VQREEAEYRAADRIFVASRFAFESFIANGCEPTRLSLVPQATMRAPFASTEDSRSERIDRIRSGAPVRILFVGSLAYQKGLAEIVQVADHLGKESFRMRIVGTVLPEAAAAVNLRRERFELIGQVSEAALKAHYDWADVFLFPTLQDGFAAVLSQAASAGVPLLASANCAAPDLIAAGAAGWIVPPFDADGLMERLRWCAGRREEFARAVQSARFRGVTWGDVAAQYARAWMEDIARQEGEARVYNTVLSGDSETGC
jgi:glycosyltransferase involved in cell wall biosynthesis